MKRNRFKIALVVIALVCVAAVAWAAVANVKAMWESGNLVYKDVATGADIMTIQSGTSGVQFDQTVTLGASADPVLTATAVTVTSPTTTFSGTGMNYAVFTVDGNMSSAAVTGGVAGQVLLVRTGAGSNTLTFVDNGTTFSLGSDYTMTEGQNDTLLLVCTEAGKWALVSKGDN